MPVKPNFNPHYFYFMTTTAVKHVHLFRQNMIKQIIVDSFHHLRIFRGMKLFVFVVMPNHIHLIAHFIKDYPLSDVMRDLKKFTAWQIYHHFLAESNNKGLDLLRIEGLKVKQEYKVWEDGYDARDVFSIEFLQQKMDYIHHNPCRPHWNLVNSPEEYLWSTAGFYLHGNPCVIPIDDVRAFLA